MTRRRIGISGLILLMIAAGFWAVLPKHRDAPESLGRESAKDLTSPKQQPADPPNRSTQLFASTLIAASRDSSVLPTEAASSKLAGAPADPVSPKQISAQTAREAPSEDPRSVGPQESKEKPKGWSLAGKDMDNCTLQSDRHYAQAGNSSALLRSVNTSVDQWCAILQRSAAGHYAGARLQFSAYLSTHDSMSGGALWFRAEDALGQTVAFEIQENQPISVNSPWTFEVIVIDVPESARALFYGAEFRNGGSLSMDSAEFDVVDVAVPVTGRPFNPQTPVINAHLNLAALPARPTNLNFEETEP